MHPSNGPLVSGCGATRPRRPGHLVTLLRERLWWGVPLCAWNGAFFLVETGTSHPVLAVAHGMAFLFSLVLLGREPQEALV
jgi:hypothetical protein